MNISENVRKPCSSVRFAATAANLSFNPPLAAGADAHGDAAVHAGAGEAKSEWPWFGYRRADS
jgi:hypothetical protein